MNHDIDDGRVQVTFDLSLFTRALPSRLPFLECGAADFNKEFADPRQLRVLKSLQDVWRSLGQGDEQTLSCCAILVPLIAVHRGFLA